MYSIDIKCYFPVLCHWWHLSLQEHQKSYHNDTCTGVALALHVHYMCHAFIFTRSSEVSRWHLLLTNCPPILVALLTTRSPAAVSRCQLFLFTWPLPTGGVNHLEIASRGITVTPDAIQLSPITVFTRSPAEVQDDTPVFRCWWC